MSANNSIVFRKVRNTEYMKKFRDPKWETFSKCYEDSVKYRLSRRVMEQTHRPLFVDGWDSGSESSGRSSPKLNDVSNGKHYASSSESRNEKAKVLNSLKPQVNGDIHTDASTVDGSPPLENGFKTANGPSESIPKRRPRQRTPRLEPRYPDKDLDSDTSQLSALRKPPRAKSQPPGNTNQRTSNRENRRSFIRHDWAENHIETRNRQPPSMRASVSAGEIHWADVGVQTRRQSEKRGRGSDHRRARSADLEKCRRSQLSIGDGRWMTEYMRCFSARLRFDNKWTKQLTERDKTREHLRICFRCSRLSKSLCPVAFNGLM